MNTDLEIEHLVKEVVRIARQAGACIVEIYQRGFNVDTKIDGSPLTTADRASHELITEQLSGLDASTPVLSEESSSSDQVDRMSWRRYWLVDPLDGTREFVKRNGEFTVNIALIEGRRPVLGVVHTPVKGLTHWSCAGGSAFREADGSGPEPIHAREYHGGPPVVAASRSHARGTLQRFLNRVEQREGGYRMLSMGSALKICLIAEGRGDVYPRLGPTYEWDTAAAQCVLESAGGKLTDLQRTPFRYNKDSLLNPWFVASGIGSYDWCSLLEGIDEKSH